MRIINRCIHHSSAIVTTLILVTGSAAAQTIQRSQLGSSFEIRYGTVTAVDRVKVQSQAAQGAVTGGIIGGVTSGHHHRSQHALEGAVAGALLTALLEGNRRAYEYMVKFDDGRMIKVVIESGGIVQGDCVSVELGRTAKHTACFKRTLRIP